MVVKSICPVKPISAKVTFHIMAPNVHNYISLKIPTVQLYLGGYCPKITEISSKSLQPVLRKLQLFFSWPARRASTFGGIVFVFTGHRHMKNS
jgi:hypothetical protein